MSIVIKLSDEEELHAQHIGKHRNLAFETAGGGQMNTSKSMNGGERGHVLGFKCEIACAKALGLMPEDNVFDRESFAARRNIYDLGGQIEVRGTELLNGRLIVRPDDKDNAPYVLVIRNSKTREYVVAGWLFGYEAKNERYLSQTRQGQKMFFVPQDKLYSVDDLIYLIQSKVKHGK